ncbi:hypothetical protein FOB72_13535 [Cupriavidus pauculus]|uniref:Secreted protein n=1 Tax=Cupriavidus pauculus TaxID=82633 RepID=A0A5P2H640_9BURK|nr:hypothetical protein [Cupriavidus pauculus]QET02973.1 hypothetical protein FOB72_13535 [Cupriavidus pauculus]
MSKYRFRTVRAALAITSLTMLMAACGKDEGKTAGTSGADDSLPKECVEAEAAQRACTEAMASGYDRLGQSAAAKTLREAIPQEMDKVRAQWRAIPDKENLARACAATRDGIRAQPQCNKG